MAHIAAAGSLASVLMLAGCKDVSSSMTSSAPPQVDVAEVQLSNINLWDEYNGRVSAVESVEVRPRVTGYITKVAYTEGRQVKKGDLLFVIDPRPYRAQLESVRAQMERAKSAHRLAKQQDARVQTLFSNKAASREEAEERRAALEISTSELRAAEAAVTIASLNLEFTEVRSPIEGVTSQAQLTIGNLAVADQSLLTSVASQDPIHVYFDPDEHSFLRYRDALKSARSANTGLIARIGLANDQGFPYEGKVGFIDNRVNPTTGTIQARAIVNNAGHSLTPGLFARVQFSTGEDVAALLIDNRAILTDQNRKFVYVLGDDNTAIRRDVQPGKMIHGLRMIEAGLQPGEKVVVSGLQRIYGPGTVVSPNLIRQEADDGSTPSAALAKAASR